MTQTSILDVDSSKDPMKHIYSLAFNRSTSSTGDTEGCYYIQKQLESVGIETQYQYFSFDTPYRILIRIAYVIMLIYLILYRLLLVVAFYFGIKYLFATTRNYSLVRQEDSKNLLATIPAQNDTIKRPVIILTAHYDSFSANIPYRLQNVLFFIFRIIIIPYFALTLTFSLMLLTRSAIPIINMLNLEQVILISSIFEFVFVSIIFLLIYDTKKSKGAIDNASGVSVLIEISKYIAEKPLENYDVIVLFTGAEEWGLLGSKRYCKRNRKYLRETYDLDRSFNINVDMVGSYVGMIKKKAYYHKIRKDVPINEIIDEIARDSNISITKHHKIISPKTDHKSFKKFARKTRSKFQVVCFHSVNDSKYIHSRHDTPDKCNPEALKNAISVIYNSIKRVDSQIV